MKMIVPIEITDAIIDASDVPEDDTYSEYDAGTAYVEDDIVYRATTTRRYICIQAGTGQTPETSPTYWSDYGAATRWRPFDGVVARTATKSSSLYYEFVPTQFCDGLALFNLNGSSVRVEITNLSATKIVDTTTQMVDKTNLRNWPAWYTWTPEYRASFPLTQLPIYAGYTVRITVSGSGTVQVGELVLGRVLDLGSTGGGGVDLEYEDYSVVETNEFGERTLLVRDYAGIKTYEFRIPRGSEEFVLSALAGRRAKPTVFLTHVGNTGLGTLAYGVPIRPQIVIRAGAFSVCRLRVEEVT